MTDVTITFTDSSAYEQAMGRWSRAVAPIFLHWLAAPSNAGWLDIGCGTGVLTQSVLEFCEPTSITGIDPAADMVAQAKRITTDARVTFRVADARRLPFENASFDIVASALVLNFIPGLNEAMMEIRRVTRAGGNIAAYVWNFADELSPSGPLRRAMRRSDVSIPPIPGTAESQIDALGALFLQTGLEQIETKIIEVCLAYPDFDTFWQAQMPSYAPTTKIIASMTEGERSRLMRAVEAELPAGPGGLIEYFAKAHAIKARVPLKNKRQKTSKNC